MRRMSSILMAAALVLAACSSSSSSTATTRRATTTIAVPGADGTATTAARGGGSGTPAERALKITVGQFARPDGAVDVWGRTPDDITKVAILAPNVAFGTFVSFTVGTYTNGSAQLFLTKAGTATTAGLDGPDGKLGSASFDPPDKGDEFVVFEQADDGFSYQTSSMLRADDPLPAGKGGLLLSNVRVGIDTKRAVIESTIDGTCHSFEESNNDTVVPLDPGPHAVELRDVQNGACASAPAVATGSVTITAGQITFVAVVNGKLITTSYAVRAG